MESDDDKILRVRAAVLELGPKFQPAVPISTIDGASAASAVIAGFKAQRQAIGARGGRRRKAAYEARDGMVRLMAAGLRSSGHTSRKRIAEQIQQRLSLSHPDLTYSRIYRLIGSK